MKRILSILLVFAMIITMFTAIVLPAVAEETTTAAGADADELINLFSLSDAQKGTIATATGKLSSNDNYYSTGYIEVAPGDTLYFGINDATLGYQLYIYADASTTSFVQIKSTACTIVETVEQTSNRHWAILSYTIPEGYTQVRVTCRVTYADQYLLTRNQPFTNVDRLLYFDLLENLYNKTTATAGYYTGYDTVKASSSHYSAAKISVAKGETLYYGPANADQSFQLYFWDADKNATKVQKAAIGGENLKIVDTFNGGQVLLSYTAPEAGEVGIVDAAEYNDFFFISKIPITVESYYGYCDLHSEALGNYSSLTGRYNHVEAKKSVLNGKSALFCGDSICIAAADDDYFNDLNLGGWAGRIAMNYGLERAVNNGVSGAALSNTRDRWYNAASGSTSKQQGRIYWQVTREASYQYDYIVLHGGVNDAWDSAPAGEISDSFDIKDFDLSTYAGGLEATIYYATKYHPEAAIGYILNFASPTNTTGSIANMGEIYFELGKKICEKWGISYLDLYNTLNGENFDLRIYANQTTADLIHPTAAGYNIIAPYVGDWMETLQPYSDVKTDHDKTVIACVGDSLTKGEQSGDINRYSYPAYLQEMLGNEYDVLNLGWGGAAAQTTASNTYKATVQYKQSLEADPDAVIVMLGANDAKTANWDTANHTASRAAFKAELKKLVQEYQALPSKPTVYLANTPYSTNATRTEIYNNGGMLTAISEIATELGVELIDTYTPTSAHADLLSDGTHFTAAGYELLAGEIYKAIMDTDTAPDVPGVEERNTAVPETNTAKPLIRNWKEYYETATAFRIETKEDVELFGDLISAGYTFAGKTVYLENDLDFTGIDFTPLGASTGVSDTPTATEYARAFQGTFDGQHHVFSNVNISTMWYQVGLFPVTSGAIIKDFGLDGGRVEGFDYIGSIIGLGCESTKLYNVWSSADVYAAYRSATSSSGMVGYLRRGSATEYPELNSVAYYGTLSSTYRIGGICGNSGTSTIAKDIVFGGILDLRSKHNAVTPLIRYSSTPIVGAASGLYIAEGTEVRTTYTYPTDIAPVEISKAAFETGEFAYYMNNLEGNTTKWVMNHGYAVPWGDENTTIHKVTVDGTACYTEADGTLSDEVLGKGSYWYKDGVCYPAATAATWTLNDGDAISIGVSAAGADYDNDGNLTIADATLLLKYIDGATTAPDAAMADVNANGKVNVFDAVKLLQVIRDLAE